MKRAVLFFLFCILLVASANLGFWYYQSSRPLISPLSELLSPLSTALGIPQPTPKKSQKVIYGFLPFWNFKETDHLRYNLITHLAYFGLDFGADGDIIKTTPDRYTDPGWSALNTETASRIFRRTKTNSGRTIIVLRAMTQDIIESIVNSPSKRQRVIASSLEVMSSKNFDGINIDFEYAGTPDSQTRDNFSIFVEELSTACKLKNPYCQVDIDVFADSATKYRIWDFSKITPHVDHVIVMAYDYFRSSSSQAGPVAPLRGGCYSESKPQTPNSTPCLDYDVSQAISAFTKIIPSEKILLGVPYYGYQWRTASTGFLANTYPDTGSTATYKRIQEILKGQDTQPISDNQKVIGIQNIWDEHTFTSRIVFESPLGQIQQISYEDERSLSLKYDLVNQADLAGIAIWALGYDGQYPQLWELLEQKFF